MTGYPGHNYPAFNEAEKRWGAWGWEVFNPARNFGGDTTRARSEYMRLDMNHVMSVDAIALLPGWMNSPGSLFELAQANELGLEIFNAETGLPYWGAHVHLTGVEIPHEDEV
jgi:hypothetical protein